MTSRRDFPHAAPPKRGMRFLGRLLPEEELLETKGDLEERFQLKVREKHAAAARVWFWFQILHLVLSLVKDHILWSCIMFRNNLIIAWRNIKKSKAYSALNILGLAVGMAVFILIMLFVRYELSYDRYHANTRNIYRVLQEQPGNYYLGSNVSAVTPAPLASALVQDFPEVLAATRIAVASNILLNIGEKAFLERRIYWADPQTFEIFSFPIVRGDRASALKDPFAVLLSERAAHRFFGDDDPIGRTIFYPTQAINFEFKVAGVFRDIPSNSHFIMDIVMPFETQAKIRNLDLAWYNSICHTLILLKDGTEARTFERKLAAAVDKHAGKMIIANNGQKTSFFLQPLTRIHLSSGINFELSPIGDARFVLLFASIAILVLVIACLNYMNLATAQSLKRIKEIGLRKVVGAGKGQIILQFLGDSMMLTFIALVLAVGIASAGLPAFRAFVERDIIFDPLRDIVLMPGLLLLAAAVGAAAGSYPAFFVSAFRPVSVLKSTGASKSKGRGLSNVLIVFQFAASIALIICAIGVRSQLRFIRNRDMGYERDQILVLSPRGSIRTNLEAFKTELKRNPAVLGVATSSDLPDNVGGSSQANWPGKQNSVQIRMYHQWIDYDYADLFGLKIVQGRNFARNFPSDARGAYLLNESAQKALGWADPVGRDFGGDVWRPLGKIVGVVKDFHMHSLHLPIVPLYIMLDPKNTYANRLSIKIQRQDIPATLAFIRETWKRFEPRYPIEYSFFDEIFDRAYRTEQRLGTMFSAFASLAVLIACLGLLGMASFTAEQKTKEIGIRKVLGASSSGVVVMLSRDFLKWVVLANLIAWPIGYFAMRSWLRNFAYRTSLTVPMFLGAGLAAFIIAAAVISLRTYKAASANPADSIRYE